MARFHVVVVYILLFFCVDFWRLACAVCSNRLSQEFTKRIALRFVSCLPHNALMLYTNIAHAYSSLSVLACGTCSSSVTTLETRRSLASLTFCVSRGGFSSRATSAESW